jgi:site-specific recombinase XerC
MRAGNEDRHVITFGRHRVTLYRRTDVHNSSWFFSLHLREEDRKYRKSLRTDNLNEAKKAAQTEVINILAKVQSGQRILALSLKDLFKRFTTAMAEQINQGQLSKSTWSNQKSRVTNGLKFLATKYKQGVETKVTNVDGKVFHDYLAWRIETKKRATIRRDVVRDELLIIRKMFLWAKKEKLCGDKSIPNWDFIIEKEGPKRERINITNFKDFFNVVTMWTKEAKGADQAYNRALLLHICALVSISGLRSGEVFGLLNSDIESRGDEYLIKVRAETSKVRRDRQIVIGAQALEHWLNRRRHTEPKEFLFSPYHNGRVSGRDTFYHQYKSLRIRLADIELDWFDLYHCRHWWITCRLLAEEPIHLVARAAGTSVKEIESTYSHVMTELTTKRFNQKKVVWAPDGSYEIIQKQLKALT